MFGEVGLLHGQKSRLPFSQSAIGMRHTHLHQCERRFTSHALCVLLLLAIAKSAHAEIDVGQYARPNIPNDQTAAFQRAVDTAWGRGDPVVTIPPGRYCVSSIRLFYGIQLRGEGAVLYVPQNKSVPKFNVILTFHAHRDRDADRRRYQWSQPKGRDSPMTLIEGVTLIGDRLQWIGEHENHQREHSHGIAAIAAGGGRLRITIREVVCHQFTGNGLYGQSAEMTIENVKAHHCFRGALSVTHNTVTRVTDLVSYGPNGGIDLESESGPIVFRAERLRLENDFDAAFQPGSQATFFDVICKGPPFNLVNRASRVRISDGEFVVAGGLAEPDIRLRNRDGTTLITSCKFTGPRLVIDERGATGHKVHFIGCTLNGEQLAKEHIARINYKQPDDNLIVLQAVVPEGAGEEENEAGGAGDVAEPPDTEPDAEGEDGPQG